MNWNYSKHWKTSHWYGDLIFPNEITQFTEALTTSIFEYIKHWKRISQMRHLLINNLVLKNPTMVQDVWGQGQLKWNWRHSFEHKEAFNEINIGLHIFFCNDKNEDDEETATTAKTTITTTKDFKDNSSAQDEICFNLKWKTIQNGWSRLFKTKYTRFNLAIFFANE